MSKRLKLVYNILDDTFCTYCQKEFHIPAKLQKHLTKEHVGTYAYHAMLEAQTAQRIDPGMVVPSGSD